MLVVYCGYSVILFVFIVVFGVVLLIDFLLVVLMFIGLFMDRMVGFLKFYFLVFLLGVVFGKLIELFGFLCFIVGVVIWLFGLQWVMLLIVLVLGLFIYGGVLLFVVVFVVYFFVVEMFCQSNIFKCLILVMLGVGGFSFMMDVLLGMLQIQNIILIVFFGIDIWVVLVFGIFGSVFVFVVGMVYLEWCCCVVLCMGEGYGDLVMLVNELIFFVGI